MKKTNLFIITLLAVFFIACNNEPIDPALNSQINNPNTTNNPTTGVFKATFDGQTFETTSVECLFQNGFLVITATRTPNNDSFSFVIDGASVGTFPAKDHLIAYQLAGSQYGYVANNFSNINEDLGSITISSLDLTNKKISGTFNFKGYWSNTSVTNMPPKNFTNGSFTNISFITNADTNDVFTANLNGLAFSDPLISVLEIDVEGQQYIAIGGARASDRMNINIKSSLGVGSYPITGVNTDNVQAYYVITNPVYNQRANIGVITVTEKTATRIKGTFNFSTPNTPNPYVVTSGNFDVELP